MATKRPQKLVLWLAIIIPATALAGLVNLSVQQNYRQTANDPQIQMSQDAAAALNGGAKAASVMPLATIDAAKSLAPFLIVYDNHDQVVASSVQLNNQTPPVPLGVLSYTRIYGSNRLTWQPLPGVRIAAVTAKYNGGVVLAGRSLTEVEKRESSLDLMVIAAWITSFVASLLIFVAEI